MLVADGALTNGRGVVVLVCGVARVVDDVARVVALAERRALDVVDTAGADVVGDAVIRLVGEVVVTLDDIELTLAELAVRVAVLLAAVLVSPL